MTEQPILFLISDNIGECIDHFLVLTAKGWNVFSPTVMNHLIEHRRKIPLCPKCNSNHILWWGEKEPKNEVLECESCLQTFDQKTATYHTQPNYEQNAIAYLAACCLEECGWRCPYCDSHVEDNKEHDTHHLPNSCYYLYQPKVVGVVLDSAIASINYFKSREIPRELIYDEIQEQKLPFSRQIMELFLFCKLNHILMVTATTVVSKPREGWEESHV